MRIEVIGSRGVVGGVTLELFRRLGHKVTDSDRGEQPNTADVYFVCVPEEAVPEVIAPLSGHPGLVVVRSTVLPGTCSALQARHGIHISHNPESLREATALMDEFNPAYILIGECCREHGSLLEELYRPLQRPIIRTSRTVSELVKLATNCYLACLISYWNTIEEIAKRMGVSGHEVGMIISLDPRVSAYGSRLHHRYEGRCLPKDMRQLIGLAEDLGYEPALLRAVEVVNESLNGEPKEEHGH